MWLRIQSSKRGIDPRSWSPMYSALLAALLLASEVARAGDGLSELSEEGELIGSTSLLEKVMPTNENLTELAERRRSAKTSVPTFAIRPDHRAALTIQPATPPPVRAGPAIEDQQTPIRLDARAMLALNDLLLESWRAPLPNREAPLFQSSGSRIRGLEPGIPENETTSRIEHSLSSSAVGPGWLGDHVELSFNDGIAYRDNFDWRGMQLRLKIWGPAIKGDPGLGMRLRGFQLSGYPVEVRARATTDLQDVQVRIDF